MPTPIEAKKEPGKWTSECWFTIATMAAAVLATVAGILPPKYSAIVNAASVAIYTICRTLRKNSAPVTPPEA